MAFACVVAAAFAGAFLSTQSAEAGAQCGKASWYSAGVRTASGERMNSRVLAAAHRTLPFGTSVLVENLNNHKTVVVRINDRGPFVRGRVIDVTKAAAERIGLVATGIANVRITVVGRTGQLAGGC
ncbi:MAG TPA: septal ring lytic transglycosylase RlpA family protein [Bauldia sp.]|nr:septal ring lytic transglycosylase RlpA family protein [Bauldia sp.]